MRFYKKGMKRCIYEYTSARFTQIEKNTTICPDIKKAMLNNISNHWSMLTHGLYPVNEYMARIADIENITINDITDAYSIAFNNNIISYCDLSIHGTEYTFTFNSYYEMIAFMKRELDFIKSNKR